MILAQCQHKKSQNAYAPSQKNIYEILEIFFEVNILNKIPTIERILVNTPYKIALAAGLALALCLLFLPFTLDVAVIGILCSIVLLALAVAVKKDWIKYIFIAFFSLTLPLSLFEAYAFFLTWNYKGLHDEHIREGGNYIIHHPLVGYTGKASSSVQAKRILDGKVLYNARYTMNPQGLRVTPEHPHARHAVLLFGCSFTFGDGLNDTETIPWQLGQELGANYRVFNFALSGYGPHHMLAIIQNTLPDLSEFDSVSAYYIAIRTHENRAAGLKFEDTDGPRYVLEHEKAVRAGTFKDRKPFFWEGKYEHLWEKSYIFTFYKAQLARHLGAFNTEEKRFELTRAIITQGAEELHRAYPESTFTTLAYPPEIMQKLPPLPQSIPLIDMEAWFPDFATHPEAYRIPIDNHPNALAARLAAKHIADLIRAQQKGKEVQ